MRYIFLTIWTVSSLLGFAQNVGINTTGANPASSAMLDVVSTDKGILIPRVALTGTNTAAPITSPATSLMIYNTATAGSGTSSVVPGFYFWNGTGWQKLSTDNTEWKIDGNAGTVSGTNFLGTTDAQALDFRTNDIIRLRLTDGYQLQAMSSGTVSEPFYTWQADPNTGIYAIGADEVGVTTNGIERLSIGNAEIVVNDGANAADFRVESAVNANVLFVEGATNRVGIGTNTPSALLDVNGNTNVLNNLTVGNLTTSDDILANTSLTSTGLFTYQDGSQAAGRVLTSDALGNATWSSITSGDRIIDGDLDTWIDVDNSDDDVIRFTTVGTEYFNMSNGTLNVTNTGGTVKMGNGAGANDNLAGNRSTYIGDNAGAAAVSGGNNVGVGADALASNLVGPNTAIGTQSMAANTSGSQNTATGYQALQFNSTGSSNTANGYQTLQLNTGSNNTGTGASALQQNNSGSNNTANGYQALMSNNTGSNNTANGYQTLMFSTGNNNTGTGSSALAATTTGSNNTANGYQALSANTTGSNNTANGYQSLLNTNGNSNTGFGDQAGSNTTTGNNSLFIGASAGGTNTTGTNNTYVGAFTDPTGNAFNNSTAFGYLTQVTGGNMVRAGNATVTSIGGPVAWTAVSDGRFKTNIGDTMVPGIEFIKLLNPVTYKFDVYTMFKHYGIDSIDVVKKYGLGEAARLKQLELKTGFIAQEVEAAANELGFNFSGVDKPKNPTDIYGLRYASFVVPLVQATKDQQELIEQMQKQMDVQKELIEELQEELKKLQSED